MKPGAGSLKRSTKSIKVKPDSQKKDSNKHNKKWKKRNNWHHRSTKDYQGMLWKITCQQIGQPGRNGYVPRNI